MKLSCDAPPLSDFMVPFPLKSSSPLITGLKESILRIWTVEVHSADDSLAKSGMSHPLQMPRLRHLLQGLVSSQRALLFLQAEQAAAALFPEATRLAVRIALMKDLRSLSAIIGTVAKVLTEGGCIVEDVSSEESSVFIAQVTHNKQLSRLKEAISVQGRPQSH
jgi:hypothetical protein